MTVETGKIGTIVQRYARQIGVTVVLVLLVIVIAAAAEAGNDELSAAEALLLGVVEGITEFLPVSSTGHLTVTQHILGLTDTDAGKAAADSYAIAIQFGAIVAVAGLYWQRISTAVTRILRPTPGPETAEARQLALALIIAFTPAAVVGFLTSDAIKENLFGLWPTALAWFVGGIAIIVFARRSQIGDRALELITPRDGLIIGLTQMLALWPGVSRSLVTIIAASLVGLKMAAAVEFSFLLGLATLSAATLYETATNGSVIIDEYGLLIPLLGFVMAFVAAAAAVVWMVGYLERHSLEIFGWYRIAIAIAVGIGLLIGQF